MTVYLDMIFLLNCLTDAAALYVTGRLSGLPLERKRVLAASLLGGTYGALCALPGWGAAASLLPPAPGAAGQLCRCTLTRRGRDASVTALLDTGSTLTDGLSGAPVITVHWAALEPLWSPEEQAILSRLEAAGASRCLERLGPGFRLLPYQAVGVRSGLLLCFRAEEASMDGQRPPPPGEAPVHRRQRHPPAAPDPRGRGGGPGPAGRRRGGGPPDPH